MEYSLKCLVSGELASSLQVAEAASRLDEAFFRTTYERKMEEWVASEREWTEDTIEELRAEYGDNLDSLTDQKRAEAAKFWKMGSTGDFFAPDAPMRFDEAAARRAYPTVFRRMMRRLEETYPAFILSDVADPRLLALDVVSPSVYEHIKAYDALMEKASADWWKRRMAIDKAYPQFKRFHFHDKTILSFRKRGKDMVMTLNIPAKLVFRGAEMLGSEGRLAGTEWLYEEIRPDDGGYEIEILAYRRPNRPLGTLLRCEDVEIISAP